MWYSTSTVRRQPRISAVVVTLNEGPRLQSTIEDLRSTLPAAGEIVVVDDGSTDGSVDFLHSARPPAKILSLPNAGAPQARNAGARRARGDIVIFSDAHMKFARGWWEPLVAALENRSTAAVAPAVFDAEYPENVGYGMTLPAPDLTADWLPRHSETPRPVPVLPGACWAMRRDVFESTGGFDEGIVRWGSEDAEYSIRLWLLGYELLVVPDCQVGHQFRYSGEERPYPVEWSWVQHNKMRVALLHFNQVRKSRVAAALKDEEGFAAGFELALSDGLDECRRELERRRVHDDDWFFSKFAIPW